VPVTEVEDLTGMVMQKSIRTRMPHALGQWTPLEA
jgi:hypothetical protein